MNYFSLKFTQIGSDSLFYNSLVCTLWPQRNRVHCTANKEKVKHKVLSIVTMCSVHSIVNWENITGTIKKPFMRVVATERLIWVLSIHTKNWIYLMQSYSITRSMAKCLLLFVLKYMFWHKLQHNRNFVQSHMSTHICCFDERFPMSPFTSHQTRFSFDHTI